MLTVSTKEVLEAILSSIDEAIHAVDERGITIFYNAVAARHDGLAIEEVLGKHVLEAFPSLTKETSTLLKVLETKRVIPHQVQRYQNRNGREIYAVNTTIPIVIDGKVAGAVEISKDYSAIQKLTEKIVELQSNIRHNSAKQPTITGITFSDIITNDASFIEMKELAQKVAPTDTNVLLYGETGTGKELFVQAIHHASRRRNKPFIAQNCAALPESLLESLLFGTTKGSYTGAVERAGLFELAHGGTLFLDEINSMPLDLQAKLLRVLEDGIIRRIGDGKTRQVDVRVIAAMNESPENCLMEKKLRMDLYYRLNVFAISIPPLRNRIGDIPLLSAHFLKVYNKKHFKNIQTLHSDVLQRFISYHWPGNVRELKNVIEHMMIVADGPMITPAHLPPSFSALPSNDILPLRQALNKTERQLIEAALAHAGGNILQAAKQLGIPRQTLQYKLQKYKRTVR
ncbi:MAG: sigma-54 interaction domain-containing protein [Ectobacillus sp.]